MIRERTIGKKKKTSYNAQHEVKQTKSLCDLTKLKKNIYESVEKNCNEA